MPDQDVLTSQTDSTADPDMDSGQVSTEPVTREDIVDPAGSTSRTEQTVEVIIDGNRQEVPLSEVIAKYQKAQAAEKRLQEATELKRELEDKKADLEAMEMIRRHGLGSREALKAIVARAYNVDMETAESLVEGGVTAAGEKLMGAVQNTDQSDQDTIEPVQTEQSEPNTGQTDQGILLTKEHMPPEVQAVVDAFQASGLDPATFIRTVGSVAADVSEKEASKAILDSIRSDGKLSVYASDTADPDGKIRQAIKEDVYRRFRETGGKDIRQAIQDTLQDWRNRISTIERAARRASVGIAGLPASEAMPAAISAPTERPTFKPGEDTIEDFFQRLYAWKKTHGQ
ncbi:MAG: hypothetical protein D6681_20275 [Calditrichaeota bacterium]|nr:MAG: hypothetical protein D6681_20275 [Calditrichota bacterium]